MESTRINDESGRLEKPNQRDIARWIQNAWAAIPDWIVQNSFRASDLLEGEKGFGPAELSLEQLMATEEAAMNALPKPPVFRDEVDDVVARALKETL